jgi:uroporphyrin-III C-methyltransferase
MEREMTLNKNQRDGAVAIVGAGPGDPELLTLRAHKALGRADVLLYDHLVDSEILAIAPPHCRQIDVGKIPQGKQTSQALIHRLMVREARQGSFVVRLKGGDPFVFGRGAEEAAFLSQHGIDFEIVPGISSCISAPGSANIPVTHRGRATHFSVITGRSCGTDEELRRSWRCLAEAGGTLVFLMGVRRLDAIVTTVLQAGRPADTPCAVIERGTTQSERVIEGSLRNIIRRAGDARVASPATIIIGDVVRVRAEIMAAGNGLVHAASGT